MNAGRNFKVFGESGNDTFSSNELSVSRKLRLNMGQGDDNALLRGSTSVGKTAKFRLGSGNDFLGVLPDNDSQTQFRRRVTVDGAAGDDTIAFDNEVNLRKRAKINGGSGADVVSGNDDQFTGNARVRGFEEQASGNVAAIVDAVFARLAAVGIDNETGDDSDVDAETQSLTLTGTSTTLNFVENSAPVSIDSTVLLSGPETTSVSGATITVDGFQPAQDQLVFADTSSITGAFDAGALTLTGNATISDYQAALREVTFQNTSDAPTTDDRQLQIAVTSDQGDASISRLLTVIPINDSPSITLTDSVLTTSDLPLVLNGQLVLSDVDSAAFSSAIVAITSGFESGQDRLTFTPQDGVNGTFDPSTGALTISGLSGDLELETLQDVLRSVTFGNDSETLVDGDRTIRFTVLDDLNASVAVDLEVALRS